jgi:hypothetical protein
VGVGVGVGGVAPTALGFGLRFFPVVTHWANLCRAYGAGVTWIVRFDLSRKFVKRNDGEPTHEDGVLGVGGDFAAIPPLRTKRAPVGMTVRPVVEVSRGNVGNPQPRGVERVVHAFGKASGLKA